MSNLSFNTAYEFLYFINNETSNQMLNTCDFVSLKAKRQLTKVTYNYPLPNKQHKTSLFSSSSISAPRVTGQSYRLNYKT